MEFKLIVNDAAGFQKEVKIKKSGSYFDPSAVVWDERVHGSIPEGTELGGLQRYLNNGVPALRVIQANKTAHDTALASFMSSKALEAQVVKTKARMEFGKNIIATMTVSSVSKNLSFSQRRQNRGNLADIKAALETGALDDAKDLIDQVTPDGTLVTASDKASVLAMIQNYIDNE